MACDKTMLCDNNPVWSVNHGNQQPMVHCQNFVSSVPNYLLQSSISYFNASGVLPQNWFSEPCLASTTNAEYFMLQPLLLATRFRGLRSSKSSTDNDEPVRSCSPVFHTEIQYSRSLPNFVEGNTRNETNPDFGRYDRPLLQRERIRSDGDQQRQIFKKRILRRYIEEERGGVRVKKRKTPPNERATKTESRSVNMMTSSSCPRRSRSLVDISSGSSIIITGRRPGGENFPAYASENNAASVISKPYKCDICEKRFSRSDMLTRHMRLHTGAKPYSCNICNQVFSRSDHLSTHQRTHTGEKPYQCPQCSYAASRRDMITRHLKTHGKTKPKFNVGSTTETKAAVENCLSQLMQTHVSVIRKVGN